MADDDQPRVLSVSSFVGVRLIDGGDTAVMRFLAPDSREIAVLVPRQAALALQANLFDQLSQTVSRDFHKP